MWIKGEKFQLVLRKTIQRNSYDLFAKETHICWPFSILAVVQVAQVFKWHSLLTYTQFSAWLSAQWAKKIEKVNFGRTMHCLPQGLKEHYLLKKKIGKKFRWVFEVIVQQSKVRLSGCWICKSWPFFHDLVHCA